MQLKAVTGLGFYCVRYPERMLEQASRDLYSSWLARHASSKKKCQVLRNLQHHLKEVETTLKVADVHGKSDIMMILHGLHCVCVFGHAGSDKQEDRENLLEFGDQQSKYDHPVPSHSLSMYALLIFCAVSAVILPRPSCLLCLTHFWTQSCR